jgi:conjugative transfer region protein TrbK
MDPKILARAGAVILLAGTVLACAVELAQRDLTSQTSVPMTDDKMDPLAGELARCKALGAEAVHDVACKAAWAQNRARFLAPGAPYQDRSVDLFPATPDVPKGTPKVHVDPAPSTPQSDGGTPSSDPEGR